MPTKALLPLPSDLSPSVFDCVCFNVPTDPEWRGLFFGALYNLTTWNSYQRTGDTSGKIVADVWRDLILEARTNPCVPDSCLDWRLVKGAFLSDCNDTTEGVNVRSVNECNSCAFSRIYVGYAPIPVGGSQAIITYFGSDLAGFPCGGPICRIECVQQVADVSQSWSVDWIDCTSNNTHLAPSGQTFILSNIESREFCIRGTNPFLFYIVLGGPKTCTFT